MAQKNLHGSVPAEIDIILFFGAQWTVMVEWVLYWENVDAAFYIEMLQKLRICIQKKRLELWAENLSVLHHNSAPSHWADSTQKFLEKNNMWRMPHPPYSPDLAPCDFFYFPEIEIGAEGVASGGFGKNKINNGRLPAEHSQIWLQKVLRWLVTASTEVYLGGIFWGGI